MHYITGTGLIVKTHLSPLDREFALNNPYYLTNILLQEKKVKYTFKSKQPHTVELMFESCRNADLFIARYRNEKLPNYDERYESNADL